MTKKNVDMTALPTFTAPKGVKYSDKKKTPKELVIEILNGHNEALAVKLLTKMAMKIKVKKVDYKLLEEMVELATTEIEKHCSKEIIDEWFVLLGRFWKMKENKK